MIKFINAIKNNDNNIIKIFEETLLKDNILTLKIILALFKDYKLQIIPLLLKYTLYFPDIIINNFWTIINILDPNDIIIICNNNNHIKNNFYRYIKSYSKTNPIKEELISYFNIKTSLIAQDNLKLELDYSLPSNKLLKAIKKDNILLTIN